MANTFNKSCPTRTTLQAAWNRAVEVYSIAGADQSRQVGIASRVEYARLAIATANAHYHALEAKAKLEEHTGEHGCDGAKAA
jgi:hypothetical protein